MSDESLDEYEKLLSLEGKAAIVTGAYGYLGSAISKVLAGFGANVILIGRNEKKLKEFTKKHNKSFNNRFESYTCDVTCEEDFQNIVEKVSAFHGSIDILVNNAYGKQYEKFEDLTKEKWNNAIDHTLTHYFTCIKSVSSTMLKAKKGSIINIASIYGFLGTDQRIFAPLGRESPLHYSVSKGSILQMTRYLATLWAEKGIRVNAISPGHFPPKRGPERPDYMHELLQGSPLKGLVSQMILLVSLYCLHQTHHHILLDKISLLMEDGVSGKDLTI